jgi:outer membrane protein assembly factor BamB
MMPVRRACSVVLACACAVAGLAGCSSGSPILRCSPPEHAYALDVTTAGRVRWQVPLPTPGYSPQQLSPLGVGAVAVFAQGDVISGLRLADGHRVWSWASSQPIAGMWRWQSLVVVLTETVSSGVPLPVLTGLDASTGQARWTLRIGLDAAGFSPTADGGLATVRWDGMLELVDLSSGRVRWTRPFPPSPVTGPADAPMAVAGGAVLVAVNGRLTSYDDQTGQVRWTEPLMPIQLAAGTAVLSLQATAGLVYLTGWQQRAGGQSTLVLLGISAADGRVKWRFVPSPPGSLDAHAPGLISVTSSSGGTWQDELDPATGRVRWQATSTYHAIATPAGIVTGSGPDGTQQISVRDTLTGQTRWTAGLNGIWLPLVVGPGRASPALPVFPAGPLLIVPAAGPDGSDLLAALRMSDGHRAWQVTIPAPVEAPLSAVPGGILIYTATVPLPC